MADLLALSSEIIDNGLTDRPFNRTSNELSEIGDGLAVVESFSHSVVVDSGDGLIAFDASHAMTGEKVVKAIKGWSAQPVSHLVYTHGHADHVGGSVAFGAEYGDMTVVGHRNVDCGGCRCARQWVHINRGTQATDLHHRQFHSIAVRLEQYPHGVCCTA